jgi:energy-coupling factor transporter transmembrane protein EcfT
LRGRGVEPEGLHGHAALLSPLLSGSLERGLNLAEAMEARGFGRAGRTRLPSPPWRAVDSAGVAGAIVLVVAGALWL